MSNVDLSVEDLGPYLEANIDGFRGLRYIDKFPGGQSNPTYRLTADSGNYVLRRKPFGKLLKSAHAVEREFRVMQALAATNVPVPRMLHLCEDDDVIGATFFIMDFIHARHFWDPSLPELDNASRTAIYDEMNRVLAALHAVDVEAVGLADFGHPGNYFERQVTRWTKQYRASETDTIAAMDALIDWLPANTPADDGRVSLIHGDYRLDNLLFAEGSDRITAVLDWELSTLGHPFADLAYQCMQLRMPADSPVKGLAGLDRKALGIPEEREYVERYCERAGFDDVPDWTFCLAFSFFRLAAILQGVKKRALDGNASSTTALEYGAYTASLAAMGVGLIEGPGE
ncbi:MAG: phosphotransferase family protein [Woeseiaceae bacterium]|nr:phosphotransferase family protein [Woeseiaceae bacterium]